MERLEHYEAVGITSRSIRGMLEARGPAVPARLPDLI